MRYLKAIVICLAVTLVARAETPLADRVGKPLKITGTTVDGKDFSTEPLKGKVILIDFWATWCVPCVQELPRVKQMMDQYHDKGLEVVGVASDYKLPQLQKFLAAHPEYAWPQLFDSKSAKDEELHPAAQTLGIDALPVMIVIDKKGVCRSVKGADEMEALIPKLLAE